VGTSGSAASRNWAVAAPQLAAIPDVVRETGRTAKPGNSYLTAAAGKPPNRRASVQPGRAGSGDPRRGGGGGPPQQLKRLVTDTSTLVSGFGWGGPLARSPTLH
jgi:hypothetical protein